MVLSHFDIISTLMTSLYNFCSTRLILSKHVKDNDNAILIFYIVYFEQTTFLLRHSIISVVCTQFAPLTVRQEKYKRPAL